MARHKPPYWCRWLGLDATATCDRLKEQIDVVELGILDGARHDETVARLQAVRNSIDELRDELRKLQGEPRTEDLLEWVLDDEILMTLIRARE